MKPFPYSVSIQWGRSYHYFVEYCDTLEQASRIASERLKSLEKRRRGGRQVAAKPRAYVWQLQQVLPPIPPGE